jgi:hypothetical protein
MDHLAFHAAREREHQTRLKLWSLFADGTEKRSPEMGEAAREWCAASRDFFAFYALGGPIIQQFPQGLAVAMQEHFSQLAAGRMPETFADAVDTAPRQRPPASDHEISTTVWAGVYMAAAERGSLPGVGGPAALDEVMRRFKVGRRAAEKWRKAAYDSELVDGDPAFIVRQMEIGGQFYTQPRSKVMNQGRKKKWRER